MFYSNILVAYDGSELGDKALDRALELAELNRNVKINVVHVIYIPPSSPYSSINVYYNGTDELIKEQGRKTIEKAEGTLSCLNDERYESQLLEGQPSEEILNYAKQEKCDLIIMGSRGLSNLKELFLGSVSHHIVQRSDVPVLIIK